MDLRSLKKRLYGSEFNKNVLDIFTGSLAAQVIILIALPVLTRIFTTSDSGNLHLLSSTPTSLSVVGSFRYELAIVIPASQKEAGKITLVAFLNLILFTLLCSVVFLFFGHEVFRLLSAELLYDYLYYVILGVFFMGLWQIVQYILIRDKKFSRLSVLRVVQALLIQLSALALGLIWGRNATFLIIAQICGFVAVCFFGLKGFSIKNISGRFNDLGRVYWQYRKFAFINTPSVFVNTFAMQLPVFMFSAFFNEAVVGLYMMANKFAATPFRMVSRSVSQVYIKSASDAYSKGAEKLHSFFVSSIKKLGKAGLLPSIGILLFAPLGVDILLEAEWSQSALYMQILTFFLLVQFIASPISQTFSVIDKQELLFILTLVSLAVRFGAMYLFQDNVILMLSAFSVTAGGYYLLILYLLNRTIRAKFGANG